MFKIERYQRITFERSSFYGQELCKNCAESVQKIIFSTCQLIPQKKKHLSAELTDSANLAEVTEIAFMDFSAQFLYNLPSL